MRKRNLLAVFVFMVSMLVVSLCISSVASAQGKGKKGKKLPKHARDLQVQIDANKASIEDVQLIPGPDGPQGDKGDAGPKVDSGLTGDAGPKGDTG